MFIVLHFSSKMLSLQNISNMDYCACPNTWTAGNG